MATPESPYGPCAAKNVAGSKPVRLPHLLAAKAAGTRLTMLTAYDALTAAVFDEAGMDMILVGDSIGNVMLGHGSTLPVSLDEMVVATRGVARAVQRAFIVAVLVGLAAPVVGTYLVQRGLALLGDGIGHIALTGIALGWLAGAAANVTPHDAWAVPGAIIISVLGAVMIEVIRANGRTRGDVALAILFYGGIAGGVILIRVAGGTTTNLNSYLFGSISTVSVSDAWFTIALATLVLLVGLGLRGPLFALCHDEEFARSMGLPTGALNVLVAVVAALTVSVSMRVVGALLVSAVMIVPVAIAQLVSYSFARTMRLAMGIGVAACVSGLTITYFVAASPGAMIVVLLVGLYAVVAVTTALAHLLVRLWARLQPVPARLLSPSAPPTPPQEPSGAHRPTTDEAPAQERQS